jgi:hypothetical protein
VFWFVPIRGEITKRTFDFGRCHFVVHAGVLGQNVLERNWLIANLSAVCCGWRRASGLRAGAGDGRLQRARHVEAADMRYTYKFHSLSLHHTERQKDKKREKAPH